MDQKESKKTRKLKTVSQLLGDGVFYPDLPKVPWADCLNRELVLEDAKIIKDFNGQFGKHDAALMLFSEPHPEAEPEHLATGATPATNEPVEVKFTTICSGQVILDRLQKLLAMRALPCLVTPTYVDEKYYNLK